MKVILLSAGKGSRLLPLTENKPKCLLPLEGGYTILSWQLTQLEAAGADEAVVVAGFRADMVREEVEAYEGSMPVRVVYNPFFQVADNLATLWLVREEMNCAQFCVLNGDTIFTEEVARALMNSAKSPITLTTSVKDEYDEDDMKVIRDGARLQRVSKKLDVKDVNAESIGFMMFQDMGAHAFRARIEDLMAVPEGLNQFYLSVIDALAEAIEIGTVDVATDQWQEVDYPCDYKAAVETSERWLSAGKAKAVA